MKTLYKQFLIATLFILAVSILIGFTLANFFYLTVTKEESDQQNVAIAQEIVDILEQMHGAEAGVDNYLNAVAKLGYQIYTVNEEGEETFYGASFDEKTLPEEAAGVLENGEIYHGINDFSNLSFMMGHFANELQNTVGVPFTHDNQRYGLFLRPDLKLMSSDIHTVLMGFVLAAAIVNILGMLWLARQLTRPITQLTEATRQIARENYSFPLNIQRKDEIGQLSESFDLMQTQLQHNDLARKAFINNVSHDFQSPLMNIQGYAELLKSPHLSGDDRAEYAFIIDQEAKRLSSLTRQLLLLTSLDQAAYPMKRQVFRLDEQLKEVVKKYRWRLEEENIDLSYKLDPVQIRADEELLGNVWDNLLTNAIKYNKPGGLIEIGLSANDSAITVIFQDTGIGMAPAAVSQVFERFFRVDAARMKTGTGLGLPIAQQIVELHGGEISISSTLGEGSRFTITFPRSALEK